MRSPFDGFPKQPKPRETLDSVHGPERAPRRSVIFRLLLAWLAGLVGLALIVIGVAANAPDRGACRCFDQRRSDRGRVGSGVQAVAGLTATPHTPSVEHMSERPNAPRSVTDWYTDAITVLENACDRVNAMNAPVVQADLVGAMELAKGLVRIHQPDAH